MILANREYDPDTVDDCLQYFRISSNAVYPFRQDGKTLGTLHKLSSEFAPTVRKQTHEDILNLIEKRLCDLNYNAALGDCLTLLRKELSLLPVDGEHYGLVHYDFECDNVFYDEDRKVCNVIDFDDGIYHFYAIDIEQALDSIAEEAPEGLCSAAKEAFLDGYKTEFLYDEATESMLPIMRRFCDMYSYTKLLYCLFESVQNEPDWMLGLKEKLTKKAEYLLGSMCENCH